MNGIELETLDMGIIKGCSILSDSTICHSFYSSARPSKGSRKKSYFLSGRAFKGFMAKRVYHLGKKNFLNVNKKVPIATKPGGGGLKALVAGPPRNLNFFAASLREHVKKCNFLPDRGLMRMLPLIMYFHWRAP